VKRELGALAHGADEQADAHRGDQHPARLRQRQLGEFGSALEDLGVVERSRECCNEADAEDEAEVADAVDEEGLQVGEDGRRLGVPEADEQVADQSHRLPAEEQLQEVVAHDEHQHREGEQRDVGEEPLVAGVVGHVADGVDVDHQRNERDDAHHHGRQAIDEEAHLHLQAAQRHPGVHGPVEARAFDGDRPQHHRRQHEGDGDAEDRHEVGAAAADDLAGQPGDQCTGERGQRHREEHRWRERGSHGVLFFEAKRLSPSVRRVPGRRSSRGCGTAPRGSQGRWPTPPPPR
jgi:hypothetical protein